MNIIIGLLIIGAVLWAYASFMEFAFTKALGESAAIEPSPGHLVPPQSADTPTHQFTIKFCRGCNKRTGFEGGECNYCAMPEEDADLKPCEIHKDIEDDSRKAHMDWCKRRALDYLPHDLASARASFLSDLGKHPETEQVAQMFAPMLMLAPFDAEQFGAFIEGFN